MKLSLQNKITLVMWVLSIANTVAAGLLISRFLIQQHQDSVRQQLQATAASLISLGISHVSQLKDFGELNVFIEDALGMESVNKVIRVYSPKGKLIFSSIGLENDMLPGKLDKLKDKPYFLKLVGKALRYDSLVVPYGASKWRKPHYLQVVIPIPQYSQILESLWWQILALLAVLMFFSLLLSRWLTLRMLRPVKTVSEHLEKMDPEKLDAMQPLNLDVGGSYLLSIVKGVNSLLERTKEAVFRIRKMSRYVAHEMRTPLTIIRGETETVFLKRDATKEDYAEVLKSSLEEAQRLSGTVDAVLKLGQDLPRGQVAKPAPLELVPWIGRKKHFWEKTLGRSLSVELRTEENVWVRTDEELLYQLIDNLVRNIRQHTPEATPAGIVVNKDDGLWVITIWDRGPGMDPAMLNSLAADSMDTSIGGIGLHLCRTIAEVLDVELLFSNENRGGLRVDLKFNRLIV